MVKGFVPSNERVRAQLKLMTIKMRSKIDKHIDEFTHLVKVCETPTSETSSFFFTSLP